MRLKSLDEFITFLRAVQVSTSPMSARWHQAGQVSVALDWATLDELRGALEENTKYSYRDGILTLEPPRSHYPPPASLRRTFPTSKLALKASILAQLQAQFAPYLKNGTPSGLTPLVRTNVGRTLAPGRVYRAADLYVEVAASHNLDTYYDHMSVRRPALVLEVVLGDAERVQQAVQGVDDWLVGDRNVQQVILMHVDADKIMRCRERGRGMSLKGAEDVGAVWRWGRDTKGKRVLLDEVAISYHYAGYTDARVTLFDLARALGVPIPHGEKLTVVLDWNNALSSVNVSQNETGMTNGLKRAVL